MKTLYDMTVKEYLEAVASPSPAPGGGSAAALCAAQGAGLVSMAAFMTKGKKKFLEYEALYEEVTSECASIVSELTNQIEADTQAYNQVAAAFKLPKDTPEEIAARRAKISEASLEAAKVPFKTMELAVQALKAAGRLSEHFNTNCASDLGVAAFNLKDGAGGAWMNVRINLTGMEGEEAGELLTVGASRMDEADRLAKEILTRVEQCL